MASRRVSYQLRYSFMSSKKPPLGASGCQIAWSGNSSGSATSKSSPLSAGTYSLVTLRSRLCRLPLLPPVQYCRLVTKLRASCALSLGRYLRMEGSVRTSLSMFSSKFCEFLRAFFIMSPMMLLLCPSCAMLNLPSLLRRITAGMEGKTRHASMLSRFGSTASLICISVVTTILPGTMVNRQCGNSVT